MKCMWCGEPVQKGIFSGGEEIWVHADWQGNEYRFCITGAKDIKDFNHKFPDWRDFDPVADVEHPQQRLI